MRAKSRWAMCWASPPGVLAKWVSKRIWRVRVENTDSTTRRIRALATSADARRRLAAPH
ncbi:MAG: hypothetical protein ACM3NV_02790 [Syntrophothermus sp.]